MNPITHPVPAISSRIPALRDAQAPGPDMPGKLSRRCSDIVIPDNISTMRHSPLRRKAAGRHRAAHH
jgi:hypothetical protein